VQHVCHALTVSERRACKVLDQTKSTQRRELAPSSDEKQLTHDIIELASQYGRYGYRRITALLNNNRGWRVNHKRVERIWRTEGLKVPKKQPKRGRLWMNDGSCLQVSAFDACKPVEGGSPLYDVETCLGCEVPFRGTDAGQGLIQGPPAGRGSIGVYMWRRVSRYLS
jgi:hypothetical protein